MYPLLYYLEISDRINNFPNQKKIKKKTKKIKPSLLTNYCLRGDPRKERGMYKKRSTRYKCWDVDRIYDL